MKKLILITGIAIGYVLGTRAGQARYEQIKAGAQKVATNPKVQEARATVTHKVSETVHDVVDKTPIGDLVGERQVAMQATP